MGAQITISLINTSLTAIFLIAVHMPHAAAHRGHLSLRARSDCRQPFDNIIIVFFAADDVSEAGDFRAGLSHRDSQAGFFAEQQDHRRPDSQSGWLTLIALVLGERLMGIPGLILAPVVLNYLRVEMLTVEVPAQHEEAEVLELVNS